MFKNREIYNLMIVNIFINNYIIQQIGKNLKNKSENLF